MVHRVKTSPHPTPSHFSCLVARIVIRYSALNHIGESLQDAANWNVYNARRSYSIRSHILKRGAVSWVGLGPAVLLAVLLPRVNGAVSMLALTTQGFAREAEPEGKYKVL
jgi:hypothetical protein